MADIQNIKIKYVVDDSEVKSTQKVFQNLNKEEKDMVENFKKIETEAKKANSTIQSESKKSANEIDKIGKNGAGLEGTFKKVGGAIVAAFAVDRIISFTKEVIDVTARFQKLEAVLTNTLGRESAAQAALAAIKDFAATTNFSVEELTASYVKLANQGFIPTTNELRKLADLANSTGKQFDQLTEAIIDAQTGEFERLKEFGIRASKEGDKVTFTFKGIQTQTDFTNESIRKYILSLGDLNGVLGSTEAISETLGGKISNLGDAWDSFLNSVGQNTGGIFGKAVETISNALSRISEALTPVDVLAKNSVSTQMEEEFARVLASTQAYYNQLEAQGIKSKDERLKILQEEANKSAQYWVNDLLNAEKALEDFNKNAGDVFGNLTNEEEAQQLALSKNVETLRMRIENSTKVYEEFVKQLEAGANATKLTAEQIKKLKDEEEKRFQSALRNLALEEQINTQRAKNAGATEEIINLAAQYYNDRRLEIYEKFNRDATQEYEKLVVNGKTLEIQLTKIVEEEARKRLAARLKADEDFLSTSKDMEGLGIAQYYDEQLKQYEDLYKQKLISTDRFLQIKTDIEKKQQRATLQSEIDILQVQVGLYEENSKERLTIEQELLEKQKQLRDIDVQNTIDAEKKKLEEAKKAAEIKKKLEEQAVQFATTLTNGFYEFERNNINNQLEQVRRQRDAELKLAGDNERAKNIINERFYQRDLELRRRQAQAEKTKALFDIAINTAVGVAKAAAAGAGTPASAAFIALVLATGAVQAGIVAARPLPKFKKGTKSVPGIDTGEDSVLAMLRPGEAVIPTEQNKKYAPLISGIIDGTLDKSILNMAYGKLSPSKEDNQDVIKELRDIKRTLLNLPVSNVTVDKRGIKTFLKSGDSETEFVNNYYKNV